MAVSRAEGGLVPQARAMDLAKPSSNSKTLNMPAGPLKDADDLRQMSAPALARGLRFGALSPVDAA